MTIVADKASFLRFCNQGNLNELNKKYELIERALKNVLDKDVRGELRWMKRKIMDGIVAQAQLVKSFPSVATIALVMDDNQDFVWTNR